MTIEEAIKARHSVRNYKHQPLSIEVIDILQQKINECNSLGNLHMTLAFIGESYDLDAIRKAVKGSR